MHPITGFPGGFLLIPVFFHYAMVTRHQNLVESLAAAAANGPAGTTPVPEMSIS